MIRNEIFAARLPEKLKKQVDELCALLDIRKKFLIAETIQEKVEDLLDAYDLRQAVKEATGFRAYRVGRRRKIYRR